MGNRQKGRARLNDFKVPGVAHRQSLRADVSRLQALDPELDGDMLLALAQLLHVCASQDATALHSHTTEGVRLLTRVAPVNLRQVGRELWDGLHEEVRDAAEGCLYEFRVTAAARLWGYIVDDVFFALWWDPHHKVFDGGRR